MNLKCRLVIAHGQKSIWFKQASPGKPTNTLQLELIDSLASLVKLSLDTFKSLFSFHNAYMSQK